MGKLSYKRANGLTVAQRNAIDLLITGATDAGVANVVGVKQTTVAKWRLYDPLFKVELNRLRAEAWGGASDSLRLVIPMALDTMRDQLRVGPSRGRLALDLLSRIGLMGKPNSGALAAPGRDANPDNPVGIGHTSLDDLLDAEVRRRRAALLSEDPDFPIAQPSAPVTDDEREAAYEHLSALAAADDGALPPGVITQLTSDAAESAPPAAATPVQPAVAAAEPVVISRRMSSFS